MKSPELHILERIEALRAELARPVVVALDGGSGSGKSTIAARLAKLTDIALVTLDDFYQTQVPESEWPHKTVAERLNRVFEWDRVREAYVDTPFVKSFLKARRIRLGACICPAS